MRKQFSSVFKSPSTRNVTLTGGDSVGGEKGSSEKGKEPSISVGGGGGGVIKRRRSSLSGNRTIIGDVQQLVTEDHIYCFCNEKLVKKYRTATPESEIKGPTKAIDQLFSYIKKDAPLGQEINAANQIIPQEQQGIYTNNNNTDNNNNNKGPDMVVTVGDVQLGLTEATNEHKNENTNIDNNNTNNGNSGNTNNDNNNNNGNNNNNTDNEIHKLVSVDEVKTFDELDEEPQPSVLALGSEIQGTGISTESSNALDTSATALAVPQEDTAVSKCPCGSEWKYQKASECYDGSTSVYCDTCRSWLMADEMIYHCPRGKVPEHENGADLCKRCYQRECENKCLCEKSPLKRTKAKSAYPSTSEILCNSCGMSYGGDEWVYNCPRGACDEHKTGYDLCRDCFFKQDDKLFVDDMDDTLGGPNPEEEEQYFEIRCHCCSRQFVGVPVYYICEKNTDENMLDHLILCEYCHIQVRELRKIPELDVVIKDIHITPHTRNQLQISPDEMNSEQHAWKFFDGYYPRCSLMKMCLDLRADGRNKRDPRDARLLMVNWKPRKGVAADTMPRSVYVTVNITHLDIQERLQDAKASCIVKFQARLLWLCEREDYVQYAQSLDNPDIEYTPAFQPKIKPVAKDVKETTEDKRFRIMNVRDFFGDALIDKLAEFENIAKSLDGKKLKLTTKHQDKKIILSVLPQHREVIAQSEELLIQSQEQLTFTIRAVTRFDENLAMVVMFEYTEKNKNKDADLVGVATKKGMADWSTKYYLTCDSKGNCAKMEKKPRSLNQMWSITRKKDETGSVYYVISSLKYPGEFLGVKNLGYPINARCTEENSRWQLEGDILSKTSSLSIYGALNFVDYEYECTIDEPFELKNYPFDYQDVPLRIKPDNFDQILPAFCGSQKNSTNYFLRISGEAVSLGTFKVQNIITEFWSGAASSEIRVLLKCSRNFQPVLINYVFLISGVCALSLTSLAVDREDVGSRLQIVLGLLLALMFIEIPKTQNVTHMDQYFFVSFFYVVAIAVQNALAQEVKQISEQYWLAIFVSFFLIYHLLFILRSYYVAKKEARKAKMSSVAIKKAVSKTEENSLGIKAIGWSPHASNNRSKMVRYDGESLETQEGLFEFMDDLLEDPLLVQGDESAKYWYFVLLLVGSALPLFASIMQIAVVFNNNCHLDSFGVESLGLLMLVLFPLAIYPLIWFTDHISSESWKAFARWSLAVAVTMCAAGQFAIVLHGCIVWEDTTYCGAREGTTSILFIVFVCWLLYYIVLSLVAVYFVFKSATDNGERLIAVFVIYVFIATIILPLAASSVQVAALQYGSGCSNSGDLNTGEAVSLFVLVLFTTLCWGLFFPSVSGDKNTAVGCIGCCNTIIHFIQFGLACHSLAYFSKASCESSTLGSWAYGLFMTWIVVDGFILFCIAGLCCFAMFQ